MCYLVAKRFKQFGSIVVKTKKALFSSSTFSLKSLDILDIYKKIEKRIK